MVVVLIARITESLARTLMLAAVVLFGVAATHGGQPGEWTRITETTDDNIFEPALVRTSDGVLHVAWLRKNGTNRDYMHTAIGKDGAVMGAPVTVLSNWVSLNNPDLIVTKDGGLRFFFGGQRTTDYKDPYSRGALFSLTAPASGASWTLEKDAHSQSNAVSASPVGAAVLPNGTPLASWAASFALQAHLGLNPKDQDLKFQTTCCAYDPDIVVDAASGEAVLGWYSNANKEHGLYTQTIAPQQGEKQYVPGSADETRNSSLSLSQRMAITARIGAPGVYVAYGAGYPTAKSVNLWRHGSAQAMVVANAAGAKHVTIAAGPEGKLWVMWHRDGRVYATRSNRDVTRLGAIVEVAPPAAGGTIYKVKGDGAVWPLDLFVACQSASGLATHHTQVLPGLSLSASPSSVTAAQGGNVTFTVTDAGDPVSGATISVAGKSLTTDANGRATYAVAKGAKPGALTATATKADYTKASARVTIK